MDMLTDICAEACRQSYDDSIEGVIVEDLKYIVHGNVIAFRGTDNPENVIRDIEVLPETSPAGHHAHGGFVKAYNLLMCNGVLDHLNNETVFTGHSMGGAIAVLFAELTGNPVVTFGCPKVYTKWGTAPNLNHVRIAIDGDPVPMLPAMCYKHDCEPVTLYPTDDDRIEIEDHFIVSYIKYLNNRKEFKNGN